MSISWDPSKISLTRKQVTEQLAATRPLAIRLAGGDGNGRKKGVAQAKPSVNITPWMLKTGEEKIIADRLSEILHSGLVAS
jgi:hypothetical protein